GEPLARALALLELRRARERQNLVDALVHRHALGIDYQIIVLRIGPLHAEVAAHDGAVRFVVDPDLVGDARLVVAREAHHHALLAQLEWRTDAHAHHMPYIAQQMRCAPAADDGAAAQRNGIDLVGAEHREARLV